MEIGPPGGIIFQGVCVFAKLVEKLQSLKTWHLLAITVVFAEAFTLLLNLINGYIWWGAVSAELVEIGVVDAFFVSLIVAPFVIYLARNSGRLSREKEGLEREVSERIHAEERLRLKEETYRALVENSPN